jgi:hypothetical protein
MTTTLTGSSSYSNTATSPADGDTRNAASVNTPLQTVLNNTKYLYDHGRVIADSVFSDAAANSATLTATSYTTFTSSSATSEQVSIADVEVGDIIIARATCGALFENSGGAVNVQGYWRLIVTESATDYAGNEIIGTGVTGGTNYIYGPSLFVRRVCADAGTLVVKLQGKIVGSDGANNYVRARDVFIHVQHIRV